MLKSDFTHSDVLKLWTGPRCLIEAASDIGVPKQRFRRWLERGNVRPIYWPQLISAVRERFGIEITPAMMMEAAVRAAEQREQNRGEDAKAA